MFNWVVKVVPQLPEAPEADDAANSTGKRPQNNADENSEDSQAQTGVLGWLSNGFLSALPQPSSSPGLSRSNSEARSRENGERSGVMGWVAQGLTKVLPQPDDKNREIDNDEEHTEIHEVATMPDVDPLPHIPVVEIVSDEKSEVETPQFSPDVVNWIKPIIPQSIILPPGVVPSEPPTKASRSSLDKVLSPPSESLSGISLDTDSKASAVVGWFVSGLGLKMPQPALPSKDNAEGAAEVLQKASIKLTPDMVLEDVDSDHEDQQKHKDGSTSLTAPSQTENQQQTQSNPEPEPSESGGRSQKDAETQTDRWTQFIENIKKEAEGVAMATMEERLLQERIEMTRVAEEVAREAAEAIRQMASERQSIGLSLGSKELLQEEPEEELPEPQEEESNLDHCKVTE
ncbi:uncharacterized protein LOC130195438 [Pseudoliparis swirei]|uniref:uncharacterized protein LOC130195438 n=1 Tax=Pseudoliparis swirei TaxID=2059687 RepID=UPI0024BDB8BC|nr:uncharacterized protein LOC130195438 [Pseudoliparis swirei]